MAPAVQLLLLTVAAVAIVRADLYMHNPRGSNNRKDNTAATENNYLFDSQNNNDPSNGGYNVGPSMTYYAGSLLPVEWTNQHGANNPNLDATLVMQYMCDDVNPLLRDGTGDSTTTNNNNRNVDLTQNIAQQLADLSVALHETVANAQNCSARSRNKGLFTADQNLDNTKGAQATRQNNNGNRSGLECQEERDYYPYWHPSQWKDLAVLVTNTSLCDYYRNQSQNVVGKNYCSTPAYNNQADCTANGGTWELMPSWNLSAPLCQAAPYTRDNHLGTTIDNRAPIAAWTIPDDMAGKKCVLRMRYNTSSLDFNGWTTDATQNTGNGATNPLVVATYPKATASNKQITLTGDPNVDIGIGAALQMNVATNQFARTFQDRSFVFNVAPRPASIPSNVTIHNVNVRGRRGNIVQNYPAVEYDFIPNNLAVQPGDYVHVQWTGANTTPTGNDDGNTNPQGNGKQGTDRSNMIQIPVLSMNYPLPLSQADFLPDLMTAKNYAAAGSPSTNDPQLDNNGPYFNGGLTQIPQNAVGKTWNFMSTRNNDFSNRSQKLSISGPAAPTSSSGNGGNNNTAAIVAGVVVSLSVVSAAAGSAVYYRTRSDEKKKSIRAKMASIWRTVTCSKPGAQKVNRPKNPTGRFSIRAPTDAFQSAYAQFSTGAAPGAGAAGGSVPSSPAADVEAPTSAGSFRSSHSGSSAPLAASSKASVAPPRAPAAAASTSSSSASRSRSAAPNKNAAFAAAMAKFGSK